MSDSKQIEIADDLIYTPELIDEKFIEPLRADLIESLDGKRLKKFRLTILATIESRNGKGIHNESIVLGMPHSCCGSMPYLEMALNAVSRINGVDNYGQAMMMMGELIHSIIDRRLNEGYKIERHGPKENFDV